MRSLSKRQLVFTIVAITLLAGAVVWFGYAGMIREINLHYAHISNLLVSVDKEKSDKQEDGKDQSSQEKDSDQPKQTDKDKCELAQIEVSSAGYYYSPKGDQLGVGPLPPRVDIPTKYWIFWKIENATQALNNFEMSADLPEGVIWTGETVPLNGQIEFGEVSRRVVWQVDQVNPGSDYTARFEVSLVPEEQDIGQVLDLLTDINYLAQDIKCDKKVKASLGNITTNLQDDALSRDKGEVVPFE